MKTDKEKFSALISENEYINESELSGCDDNQLKDIEDKYQVKLPESYKHILKIIGHNAGGLIDTKEFDFYYKDILKMTEEVVTERDEIDAEEDGDPLITLPDKTFFILGRYEEQYHFIVADGGEDTEVYYYNFDKDSYEKDFDSVWEWIFSVVGSTTKTLDMLLK